MELSFKWIAIGGGALAIGHRPKIKDLPRMNATHVLTLFSEREGAREIERAVVAAGLVWMWLPLSNGDPHAADEDATRAMLKQVRQALLAGARIFIHCSAGIHRTGMITTAILRSLGHDREEAASLVRELRDVTADGVGASRVAWTDRFFSTD